MLVPVPIHPANGPSTALLTLRKNETCANPGVVLLWPIIPSKDPNTLLEGHSKFALIDVREAGEYNSTHISDYSLISRRDLKFQMSTAVPVKNAAVVLRDDHGRRVFSASAQVQVAALGPLDLKLETRSRCSQTNNQRPIWPELPRKSAAHENQFGESSQ